jgi:hypothetical protein
MGDSRSGGIVGTRPAAAAVQYSLTDYNSLRTRMCFFDETGTLNNPRDRFMGLGMVKAGHPCFVTSAVQHLRDRHHFYDEVKWNKLSAKKLELYWEIADMLWSKRGFAFRALVVAKDDPELDLEGRYAGNLGRAYEDLTVTLLKSTTARNEVISVLADKVVRPPGDCFEANVKSRINRDFGRLAVQGVCSVDSRGVELVQMADLLLGAVVYDFKRDAGLIPNPFAPKREFVERLKTRVGVSTFTGGVQSDHFGVSVFTPRPVGR